MNPNDSHPQWIHEYYRIAPILGVNPQLGRCRPWPGPDRDFLPFSYPPPTDNGETNT